jgi:hypothetical protein
MNFLFIEILMLLKRFNIESLITCLIATLLKNDDKNFYALHQKKLSGRLIGGQEEWIKDKKRCQVGDQLEVEKEREKMKTWCL